MEKNTEVQNRIISAIKEKTGGLKPCSLCGNSNWNVEPSYVVLPVTRDPRQFTIGEGHYPLMAIGCSKCGNTHLLNLLTLGFTDLEAVIFETKNAPK